jgi:hypothetical protein
MVSVFFGYNIPRISDNPHISERRKLSAFPVSNIMDQIYKGLTVRDKICAMEQVLSLDGGQYAA